ncbi:pyroglutamyl-peptidase I [Pseudomarimonas salicorniae]|uniref:Pyrrolidone-carboxylate peptidase n=1 Tax=Pseudomarimonas salicorniae TaxID=2933270 RepID=A0ABT0GKH3_9GAMM|nr:pyroglutamyl-peptidase I [Lysobacter sp. CAU 1642]MCK7594872.1 pyroglutamyl-peptidase I [Lysobacter sp. CAU 1642]
MTRSLPRVLLTGFEPFDGEAVNPSWEAVQAHEGREIAGHRIETLCLPVCFGESLGALRRALRRRPALVLAVGQAGGRAAIGIERVAINVDDARIPDNAGAQPIDCPVIRGAPAAYFARLPIKALRAELVAAGIPAEISHSAGTFVCNHVFFGLMHALRRRPGVRAGFVHVPYSPAQAARHPGAPSLPVERVSAALERMVEVALRCEERRESAGALH